MKKSYLSGLAALAFAALLFNAKPVSAASTVTVTSAAGAKVYTNIESPQAAAKTLKTGSKWQVYKQAKDAKGNVWYDLGGNQWLAAADTKTQAPAVKQPVGQTITAPKSITIHYVKGYGIAVWNTYAAGRHTTGKKLMDGTTWKVAKAVSYQGATWYDLGGNQWLEGKYTVNTPAKPKAPAASAASHPSVAYVNYKPGYSIAVWNTYASGRKYAGTKIKHGTAWKISKAVSYKGATWYSLGGNQWVEAKYMSSTKPTAFHYSGDWHKPSENIPYPDLAKHPNAYFLVSLAKQRVYVKDGNTTLYEMICSTGLHNATPKGTYHIQAERGTSFYNPSLGGGARYYTSWKGHGVYLFHSVPTGGQGQYLAVDGAKLGHPASHGCIRLPIPDAIWIYKHAKVGMKVIIE